MGRSSGRIHTFHILQNLVQQSPALEQEHSTDPYAVRVMLVIHEEIFGKISGKILKILPK